MAGTTTASGFGIIAFSKMGMFNAFGVMAFLIFDLVLLATILVLPAIIVVGERMASWWPSLSPILPVKTRNDR